MSTCMILDDCKTDDDERCSVCEESAARVIRGKTNCHYCGNQVNLCQNHYYQLISEIIADLPTEIVLEDGETVNPLIPNAEFDVKIIN